MAKKSGVRVSKEEIKSALTGKYNEFKSRVFNEFLKAFKRRHRVLVILSGDDPRKVGILTADILITFIRLWRRLSSREGPDILYMYHDEFDDAVMRERVTKRLVKRYIKRRKIGAKLEIAVYEASERYLGTTYQALVMDLSNSLKPNDIGRLVGVVEGGGLVVLQTPNWHDWHNRKNLFQMMLAVPQYPEPRKVFVRWFKEITMDCEGVFIYDSDGDEIVVANPAKTVKESRKEVEIPTEARFPIELYKLALTQDQVNALRVLEGILEKVRGRKRRSVILIADRGRGKSCAIGIALAGIINEMMQRKPKVRIGVTAPSPSNVQPLMNMALKALETIGLRGDAIKRGDNIIEIRGSRFSIEYWEPAIVPRLGVDIAVVDEAAGIPVPLLHKIWRSYRRTIFATTIHGYEGAGRGFSVRFLKRIKEDPDTELTIYEMEEPIRYGKDDPVERWQFRVLLLDAEPDELDEKDLEHIDKGELEYLVLEPEKLFTKENEKLLRSIFGIYVLAHYRNEPDDLGMMADAPHHSIRAIRLPTGKIVAALQLAEEGPIPFDYLDSLLRGGKIPGNIIPDRLLKHARIRDVGDGRGWRIVRIAVHPAVQGRGIGSYALRKVEEESRSRGYNWLGSGFGATEELLRFWIKNGFTPVHISPDRNPVSAEYTVLVIKPLDAKWSSIVKVVSREFREKVLASLHDTYRDLEIGIVLQLLETEYAPEDKRCSKPKLTKIQVDRLLSYCEGYMTYESCCDVVRKLAEHHWREAPSCRAELSDLEKKVIVLKVLQGLPWDLTADILRTRKSRAIDLLRSAVTKMVEKYLGIARDEMDKVLGTVTLSDVLEMK
ncbi:MAG: tRNA(Met) cytidine acetyltransferase [Crenarchaeota archaeon]|nr:tRNA(Met) cytidine acetyltransferase [Thermoproteota archaeon]